MNAYDSTAPDMTTRIKTYWSTRSETFKATRNHELEDPAIGVRWLNTFQKYFPENPKTLRILDIGTGAGYFAILLSGEGHHVTGIDLTPDMISAAKNLAEQHHSTAEFQVMNAMQLDFPDQSFDAVVTRNLTWTLPDVQAAYQEWYRVLRPDGVLLNFDANYGDNVRYEQQHPGSPELQSQDSPYGHPFLSDEMLHENAEITLSMEASRQIRPEWDISLLTDCGFRKTGADPHAGKYVMQQWDQIHSPMFLVWAYK